MPDWLIWLIDIGLVAIIIFLIKTVYNVGRTVGEIINRVENLEDETDRLDERIDKREPIPECRELFREFSANVGNLGGKMDLVIKEIQEIKKMQGGK